MTFKKNLLFLIVLLFFNCYQPNKTSNKGITSDNLYDKIDEAFLESELHDNNKILIPVLFFIENNNNFIKDSCVLSKVYHLKALKNYTLGQSKEYLQNAKLSLSFSDNCKNFSVKTSINNLLGIFYSNSKEFNLAINYFKKAIFYGEKNKDKRFIVDAYFSLCNLFSITKNWKGLIENAKKGISAIEESKAKKSRLKYLYTFLAQANTNLENYDLAEINLAKAIEITEKSRIENDKEDIIKSYREIYLTYALLNKKQHKFDLAYKYMQASDSLLILKVKNKEKRQSGFLSIENKLEDKLLKSNREIILTHRLIIFSSILFLLISFFFIQKNAKTSKKLKVALKEKEGFYTKQLTYFDELKEIHKGLIAKNEEIKSLLKFNEQTLITKTLKISNYKDAVNNVIKNINKLIENRETIKSVKLHSVNRSLQQIISEEDIWEDFKIQFEKNRPDFFDKILEKNPSLSITEQKHCAYISVNLKSKEVANILNLSPRSVETTRYRIKKKLNIKNESLQDFLNKL